MTTKKNTSTAPTEEVDFPWEEFAKYGTLGGHTIESLLTDVTWLAPLELMRKMEMLSPRVLDMQTMNPAEVEELYLPDDTLGELEKIAGAWEAFAREHGSRPPLEAPLPRLIGECLIDSLTFITSTSRMMVQKVLEIVSQNVEVETGLNVPVGLDAAWYLIEVAYLDPIIFLGADRFDQ